FDVGARVFADGLRILVRASPKVRMRGLPRPNEDVLRRRVGAVAPLHLDVVLAYRHLEPLARGARARRVPVDDDLAARKADDEERAVRGALGRLAERERGAAGSDRPQDKESTGREE